MGDFDGMLELQIPRLRRYARALTRDFSQADDLVQNCLTRAVAKQHLWQHGTVYGLGSSPSCTISMSTTFAVLYVRALTSNLKSCRSCRI